VRWRKLDEWPAYTGPFRRVVTRRYERPDGSVADYEVKAESDVVAVLALTARGEVLLVREFRVGPETELLELPGGAVEAGQTPLQAARRELLEETGHEGAIEYAGSIIDCAYSTRETHAFVATACRRVADPEPHDGEYLELVRMPLDRFRAHLRSGRLTDTATGYLALDHLGLLGHAEEPPAAVA
jgi:ADP-ribose pyrophosphatase